MREWGLAHAETYTSKLTGSFDLLCQHPDIGSQRVVRGQLCRRWTMGSHAIVFRVHGRELRVIRILHTAMDERRHLG